MPRIARPATAQAIGARRALRDYLIREGQSVNAFAKQCGIGQPTLCRFLNGRTKSLTAPIARALAYAHIDPDTHIVPTLDNARLRRAIERAWDGTDASADLLAAVIEAVGPALARLRRSEGGRS